MTEVTGSMILNSSTTIDSPSYFSVHSAPPRFKNLTLNRSKIGW